ncbi:hypothetical protein M9H77_14780 [Catharanthus roseus]|uniref:Uncharacterized protein n=1 Tax=Catharanthus roseus TaxID=4058 RepID=A0ACC0BP14_CATRO|nr:hypothetical protein M9H77_14780 [Catharanthus roseus]
MSLHIGNLSPRIRREELLSVFRRFGRCNLQVKDKFGFVMYEYPANAEEALRTLRGQKICGERINLSWSNRQPQQLARHDRGGRTHEHPRGRRFGREDYSIKNLGSDVQDDNRRGFRQVDRSSRRHDYTEPIAEAAGQQLNDMGGYVGDKQHDFVEDMPDEGGGSEENLLENDRWGEQMIGNGLEDELDFGRYELYQGDDRKEQEDILNPKHLDSASTVRKSQVEPKTVQVDQPTVEVLHNSKTESGRQLFIDRDASPMGQLKFDREASTARNHNRLPGGSPEGRLTHRVRKMEYQGKKRNRRENPTPERHESKKGRIPVSSSIHSDYTPSRSRSQSGSGMSISGSRPRSRSKSAPSKSNSIDSKSRSAPTPSPARSDKFISRSISTSSSPKSLGQPLPSSPNGGQMNKDSSVTNSGLEFKETSIQVEPFMKGDALSDGSNLDMLKFGVQNECAAAPLNVEEVHTNNHSLRRDDTSNCSIASDICEAKKSLISQSDYSDLNAGNLSQKSLTEMKEFTSNDFVGDDNSMQLKDLETEASGRLHAASLMNISSKELCMVLKNCGLEHPHKNGSDLHPEIYFGSARLWPWEIVYYRRLKKGPISKENYSLRLAQNEEFGIVDKYIRSSSGWGELIDENP